MTSKSASKYLPLILEYYKAAKSSQGFQRVAAECQVVSVDEGRCIVEFEVEEKHENPAGTLHGGLTASLLDMVTTCALLATPRAHPGVSVDLNVSYLAPANRGDTVIVDAKVIKSGRSIAFTTADFYRKRDNVMIATGRQTKAFPSSK